MKKKNILNFKNITLLITIGLFLLLLVSVMIIGPTKSNRFRWLPVFFNLFNDNAYLIVVSIGIMFVLITGNIDISVASILAFSAVFSAYLLEKGWNASIVIFLAILIGFLFGLSQGYLIETFQLPSFIVTLAGLFFLRGMCSVVTQHSIGIENEFFKTVAKAKISFGSVRGIGKINIYYYVFISVFVILSAQYVLKHTKIGRCVYAIGGSEKSARLMGLPVSKVKILVYGVSGLCASISGILFSFYTLAGYPLQNLGLELEAISSAVIGGTLLTGGVGTVIGTLFGVLIQGTIQTLVTLLNLNAWWTKVVVGMLLCLFVVLQNVLSQRRYNK